MRGIALKVIGTIFLLALCLLIIYLGAMVVAIK
jgi:hypothetical protein